MSENKDVVFWKDQFPKDKFFETEKGILYCKDNIEILSKFPSRCFDLIVIDPPYEEEALKEDLICILKRIMKDYANIYIWCGIGEKSQTLIDWFLKLKKYFHFKDLITWKKQRGLGNKKGWLYVREEIMWFIKNKNFIWRRES